MQSNHFVKAAILTLLLVTGFIVYWEYHWRSKGFPVSYNDDSALWAKERARVYQSPEDATVVIGSSRIKFDLDVETWEKLTGDNIVQLSLVGTSPRPVLHHLANDEKFKGKLLIDVTEFLFFGRNPAQREKSAIEGINYYKDQTPSQKASNWLNYELESQLVFLEEGKYGLNELLADLEIPNRKGVFSFPVFPKEFELNNARRQNYMHPRFVADTSLQNWQQRNWMKLGGMDRRPGISGDTLQKVLEDIKASIDKIRARGGLVIFVRTPANGPMEANTKTAYPRELFWNKMLEFTQTPGVHYEDYPETAGFVCPEWSHLTPSDAVTYTRHLIAQLEQKGWKFPHKPSAH